MKRKVLPLLLTACLIVGSPLESTAKSLLFHATSKALARKLKAKGFSVCKMKARARFGKGLYFSRQPKTAILEKKRADALLRVRVKSNVTGKSINLVRPTPKKVGTLYKYNDLRGTTKNGVIGPKLGHKLGRRAAKMGKAIRYRSATDPRGVNYFVPRKMYKRNPKIILKIKMKSGGRYQ